MLIVCTKDKTIREAATDPEKGGTAWDPVGLLPLGTRRAARVQMTAALQQLPANQPLCLSAHGNDTELGDEHRGWRWTTGDVARLLAANVASNWLGPVLIHACADTVANFSAGLAFDLGELRHFNGLWCFGYNRALPSDAGFPAPRSLDRRLDLQATRVRF